MASSVFLDANIILDYLLKRKSYPEVRPIFEKIARGQVQAFISPSIVHLLAYWVSKIYGTSRTRQILIALLDDVRVLKMDHEMIVASLNSGMSDIEDALQYNAALHHNIDVFVTNDKKLKRSGSRSLPIQDPEEFLLSSHRRTTRE